MYPSYHTTGIVQLDCKLMGPIFSQTQKNAFFLRMVTSTFGRVWGGRIIFFPRLLVGLWLWGIVGLFNPVPCQVILVVESTPPHHYPRGWYVSTAGQKSFCLCGPLDVLQSCLELISWCWIFFNVVVGKGDLLSNGYFTSYSIKSFYRTHASQAYATREYAHHTESHVGIHSLAMAAYLPPPPV